LTIPQKLNAWLKAYAEEQSLYVNDVILRELRRLRRREEAKKNAEIIAAEVYEYTTWR
jgi:NRPS condensation-like uncharacterized protein